MITKTKDTIAVIPARGGSKGIPNKNLISIGSKPLIGWSIQDALKAGIEEVYVTTDCPLIEQVALDYGAKSLGLRSEKVSQDTTSTEETLLEFFNRYGSFDSHSIALLMQPTSPIRSLNSILKTIDAVSGHINTTALTVYKDESFYWKDIPNVTANYNFMDRPRRQDLPLDFFQYRETGSLYAFNIVEFLDHKNRLFGDVKLIETPLIESFELDDYEDLKLIRSIVDCVE